MSQIGSFPGENKKSLKPQPSHDSAVHLHIWRIPQGHQPPPSPGQTGPFGASTT